MDSVLGFIRECISTSIGIIAMRTSAFLPLSTDHLAFENEPESDLLVASDEKDTGRCLFDSGSNNVQQEMLMS